MCHMRRRMHVREDFSEWSPGPVSDEEEDTCVSDEEEDTCVREFKLKVLKRETCLHKSNAVCEKRKMNQTEGGGGGGGGLWRQ